MKLFWCVLTVALTAAGGAAADCRVGEEICVNGGVQVCTRLTGSTTGFVLKNPYQSCTVSAPQIAGAWRLYNVNDTSRLTATMQITQGPGSRITASGAGWSGVGALNGRNGYYDWRFGDGRSGRTNFVVNADGTLSGTVAGSGINWSFVGRR